MHLRKLTVIAFTIGLVLTVGCSESKFVPYQPKYMVIPAAKLAPRIPDGQKACKNWGSGDEPGKRRGDHCASCDDGKDEWTGAYCRALDKTDGWAPSQEWFVPSYAALEPHQKQLIADTALEYGLNLDLIKNYGKLIFEEFGGTAGYFRNADTTPREGLENLEKHAREMLKRIDSEHERFLNEKGKVEDDKNLSLPRMVSTTTPVGVSIAVLNPKEDAKADGSAVPLIAIGTPPKDSSTDASKPATVPGLQVMINKVDAAKASDQSNAKEKNLLVPVKDFTSEQTVTITPCSVLNSAGILDRIEYVSTFMYIHPYQKPANTAIDLDREFWRHFFSAQTTRIEGRGKDSLDPQFRDTIRMDLNRAFKSMRTKVSNVETTLVVKDMSLGAVTRGTSDTINAGVSGSVPGKVATLNPSLNYSSGLISSTVTNTTFEADQRSAYFSPDTNFLRITQRGMTNVNIGGRYNETMQLHVPVARQTLKVIEVKERPKPDKQEPNDQSQARPQAGQSMKEDQKRDRQQPKSINPSAKKSKRCGRQVTQKPNDRNPVPAEHKTEPTKPSQPNPVPPGNSQDSSTKPAKDEGTKYEFSLRSLAQPLYPRVDALVVSVAVVRHPTKLRPTNHENFTLPLVDVAETEFIVGLPRPSMVTLWKWERSLDLVMAKEVFKKTEPKDNEKIYFDSEASGMYEPAPFVLTGCNDTLAAAFKGKIYQKIPPEAAPTGADRNKKLADAPDKALFDIEVSRQEGECPPAGPRTGKCYYIRVTDRATDAKIRLGLLRKDPEGKSVLAPFDSAVFK
jgi:hypothetical protein